MAPRSIWTGSISFGLVNVPVKLYSATEQKDVHFNQFERDTGERIRYQRVAEESGHEVDYSDIVKGYEVSKGKFVMVTPEELESADPEKTRTIDIEDFVELAEVDPIYFEKTYYLGAADAAAAKPYALLVKAMEETGKVGIARFVMRTKEYLAALRPSDGMLLLETMYFPDEIRARDDIDTGKGKVNDRELKVARQLIDSLASDWDPQRYHDTYRERVLELIKQKAKGKDIVVERPAAEAKPVEDLMAALEASLKATREGKPAKAPSTVSGTAEFAEMTKSELLDKAKDADIEGRSKMTKDELVEALQKAS